MYQIGQQVVYGAYGVCSIIEMHEEKGKQYYVLEPVGQKGSRYMVPLQNEIAMGKLHPMLTREEFKTLLSAPQVREVDWITDESRRKQLYRELIGSGDRRRLMGAVCALYRHKAARTAAGKKCHVSDDFFLRDAEKLLTGEMSVVFEMDAEEAKAYLRESLTA